MVSEELRLARLKKGVRLAGWGAIASWLALVLLEGMPGAGVPPLAAVLVGLRILGLVLVMLVALLAAMAGPTQVMRRDFWR